MTVGSLFAGIGGFDLGLERAGFRTTWQVEINEWCQKVLKKHFPNAERFTDIRDCGAHNLKPVDVICGGFPCQPFSSAGKRGGAEDDRYLWPEMLRVISEVRPRWVIAENVDELATGKLAPTFEHILSGMEGEGYDVQSFIIPACSVDADHERYRLWILGNTNSYREPAISEYDEAPRMQKIAQANPQSQRWQQCGWVELKKGRNQEGCLHIWPPEPGMDRVSDGIPNRMDRTRGLGNAVVPQIPEMLGRMILQVEQSSQRLAA
jgi:DNA (cytosine-5)-methyltransferase 1